VKKAKKTASEKRFEPSDSLKRFIPPLFEIGKINPPTVYTTRRNAVYGGRRDEREQEQEQDKDKRQAALTHPQ
jgi:hypothetical protein